MSSLCCDQHKLLLLFSHLQLYVTVWPLTSVQQTPKYKHSASTHLILTHRHTINHRTTHPHTLSDEPNTWIIWGNSITAGGEWGRGDGINTRAGETGAYKVEGRGQERQKAVRRKKRGCWKTWEKLPLELNSHTTEEENKGIISVAFKVSFHFTLHSVLNAFRNSLICGGGV